MNRDLLPVVLVVLDGWGEAPRSEWNAATNCGGTELPALRAAWPSATLAASGEAVGLPDGQIGNSEVGHLCLGAGRVVLQDLPRITKIVKAGDLIRNEALVGALDTATSRGKAVHLMGLFSPGGVHSHIDHLRGLFELSWGRGASKIFVHAFLDGRDVPPKSALPWMKDFESDMRDAGVGKIATVMGRFYGMDRDQRWDRTEAAFRAIVRGEGAHTAKSGADAINQATARGETDEFVQTTVVVNPAGLPVGPIRDGDVVIHFNFRADRARQLVRAVALPEFTEFDRGVMPKIARFTCLTEYDKTFKLPVAYPPAIPAKVFGEVIAGLGLKQARMAETEKYAHVTYFFNGGREEPFAGEERELVPSTRTVATYDLAPAMSAEPLTERVCARIRGKGADFILVNFANPDMVGHTGVYEAALEACRITDACVGRIVRETLAAGGLAVVTADHGNCEMMRDPRTNQPHTAHTTNRVPVVIAGETLQGRTLRADGQLADVAPTLLTLLGVPVPDEMEGRTLIA